MRQAVILAGGQATRLRPYTDDRPKAMVEIAGTPIVEHQIRWLAENGVEQVVVSCGYLANVLQDHLRDGTELGVKIGYAVEDEPLGRGGGLKFAAKHLPEQTERWMALNGDVLSRFALNELETKHSELGAVATIALAQYQTTWGIADLEGDLIKGFVQSPKLPYWINAGIYCFEPELTALLPDKGDHEDSTFPELAKQRKLGAYQIDGYWRGIDTVKDVKEASKELSG
ncbi:MAG TPA: nucleotidyltransferase family protein [Actinomycetota bacterium]|nr:nucleotidyltransferase family protein [Actinomycetota bacterium]